MRGLSIWFCFGKWANPQLSFGSPTLVRVCVGWFSFAVLSVDIELLLGTLVCDTLKDKEQNGHVAQQPPPKSNFERFLLRLGFTKRDTPYNPPYDDVLGQS
jgi:hypothetical protein